MLIIDFDLFFCFRLHNYFFGLIDCIQGVSILFW